ncbi:hypothetical protein D3C86_1720820 [compost metagenome]
MRITEKEAAAVVGAHRAAGNQDFLVIPAVVPFALMEDTGNKLLRDVFVILLMPDRLIFMNAVTGPNLQLARFNETGKGRNHPGILILIKPAKRGGEDKHRFAGVAVYFILHVPVQVTAVFLAVACLHPLAHPILLLVVYTSRFL